MTGVDLVKFINISVHSKVTSNYSTILDTNINLPLQSTKTHYIILKAKKKDNLKASPTTQYYQSSVPKLHHDKQIPPIPTEPNTKIATSTSSRYFLKIIRNHLKFSMVHKNVIRYVL